MLNNLRETAENIELLARFDFLDLCITGETGTGKTHLARLIHDSSPRKEKPFVAVNCAELTPSIIEAELFGYEKGAFTGALSSKTGKFEQAAGGTLFLDEIGELTEDLQAKLLKVVEEKTITRVGGNRTRRVDVRIIYATHRDLSVLREDLRYRVAAAYTIHLKPLRERRREIVPFARLFISEFSRRSGRLVRASDETLQLLETSDWRGNVRELRAFVDKACLGALLAADLEKGRLDAVDLTNEILLARPWAAPAQQTQQQSAKFFPVSDKFPIFTPGERMEDYLGRIERHLLKNALETHDNNQTHAARHLGLSRGGLIKKLKRMNH
jgi:transcriptional regulator with GAF, ATPase, and Fis domain